MVDDDKEINLIERQNELLRLRKKEENDKIAIDNLNKLGEEDVVEDDVEFNK